MSAITNTTAPSTGNVKPFKQKQKLSEATQDGFKIVADKFGRASLFRIDDEEGDQLISGGIWVIGQARDPDSMGWCNVVKFIDQDNIPRTWLMPKGLLAGDKREVIRELLERGLFVVVGSKAKSALFDYINHGGNDRFTAVESTGWHGGSFILPDETINGSDDGESYMLRSHKPTTPRQGTLDSWRESVASQCVGNSRLLLGVSAALATPLLDVAGVENGCIHYVGGTSIGKSKVLTVAATVFGIAVPKWNSTKNGIEGTAAEHSDIGLMLDEIGEMDARAVGEVVYMLGNGMGKVRASRNGTSKQPVKFRLITQSNGEKTLGEHMASAGQKAMAGQEIRILDIEADAGKGMGVFENIHEAPSSSAFADSLETLSKQHSGHAGPAFVKYIVSNRSRCADHIKEIEQTFAEAHGLHAESGQVHRAAKRFALIAAAGELATEAGITGWAKHDALRAAGQCFKLWRKNWTPSGSRESERAIEIVRDFLQTQQARFITDENLNPHNCAGYRHGNEYWIYPATLKSICTDSSLRLKAITTALIDGGHLVTGEDSKTSCRRMMAGKQNRCYVIRDSVLADENTEEADYRKVKS